MDLEKRIAALADETVTISIINEVKLNDATMYIASVDGVMRISVIVYNDGTLFHQRDWQSGNPTTAEEVEDYDWLTEDGRDAIVLSGQPRAFN